MATTYKVLGQLYPTNAAEADLYTVPAATSTVCSTLTVCNDGGTSTRFDLIVRVNGAALSGSSQYLVYGGIVNADETVFLTLGITLGAGDVVTVYSYDGQLAFNLFGSEIT